MPLALPAVNSETVRAAYRCLPAADLSRNMIVAKKKKRMNNKVECVYPLTVSLIHMLTYAAQYAVRGTAISCYLIGERLRREHTSKCADKKVNHLLDRFRQTAARKAHG